MKKQLTCSFIAVLLCIGITGCGAKSKSIAIPPTEASSETVPVMTEQMTVTTPATEPEPPSESETEQVTTSEQITETVTAPTTAATAATETTAAETTAPSTVPASTEPPRFQGKDYVGVWSCGSCNVTIEEEPEGYLVQVHWPKSEWGGSDWTYHCTYHPETWHLFCGEKGARTDYVIKEEGRHPEEKVVYSDGDAEFWLSDDGYMGWIDLKEHAADDMSFTRQEE